MRLGVRRVMPARIQRMRRRGKLQLHQGITKARLPDLPEGHPDFIVAWLAEEAKAAPAIKGAPPPGSGSKAIDDHLSSGDLDGLSETYRRMMRPHLMAIQAAAGGSAMLADPCDRQVHADVANLGNAVALLRQRPGAAS